MVRNLATVITIVLAIFISSNVKADEPNFHPSRIRLVTHGNHKIDDNWKLKGRFIPSPNLIGELTPLSYLGTGYKATPWLNLELYTGWSWQDDEALISFTPIIKHAGFVIRIQGDIRAKTKKSYYIVTANYFVTPKFLAFGFEAEGWGLINKAETWAHGVGPNTLLRIGPNFGMDLTVHIRSYEKTILPEFFTRIHIFL